MLRVQSPLDEQTEKLVRRVIGSCITVHRALGPGLLEGIYQRAMQIELTANGLSVDRERRVPVFYRDQLLCHQHVDLVVEESLVLELKSVERLSPLHQAQVLCYLRVLKLRIGLLVNFNAATISEGLKRVVL